MNRRPPRTLLYITVVSLLVFLPSAGALAQEEGILPVTELLGSPAAFDAKEITVEGELVGDYGYRRDGYMWTQLNDDSYARHAIVDGGARTGTNVGIGIRMPVASSQDLDPVGGYRREGPLVRLTGVWRFHDPGRGGESYLDVRSVVVVEAGRRLEEGPDWMVFWSGIALIMVALAIWRRRTSL